MRAADLFEYDVPGKVSHETRVATVYHLTDYEGLTNAIYNNALSSLRQNFISTTYDPKIDGIYGRNHYHFKFILDAKKLAAKYGMFSNKFKVHYTGGGSATLRERELGVNTNRIEPLSDYCDTLVILIDLFSRTFIQWMFYSRWNKQGVGIVALRRWLDAGNTVLRYAGNGKNRPLNEAENRLLEFCFRLAKRPGMTFPKALDALSRKFQIIDNWNKPIAVGTVKREMKARKVMDFINKTLTERPFLQIPGDRVRAMVGRIIDVLGFGGNFKAEVLHVLDSRGILDGEVPPVRWTGIVRDLVEDRPLEDIITTADHIAAELAHNKAYWQRRGNAEDDILAKMRQRQKHDKSGLAGVGDGY